MNLRRPTAGVRHRHRPRPKSSEQRVAGRPGPATSPQMKAERATHPRRTSSAHAPAAQRAAVHRRRQAPAACVRPDRADGIAAARSWTTIGRIKSNCAVPGTGEDREWFGFWDGRTERRRPITRAAAVRSSNSWRGRSNDDDRRSGSRRHAAVLQGRCATSVIVVEWTGRDLRGSEGAGTTGIY
jgi:hypothetical protein